MKALVFLLLVFLVLETDASSHLTKICDYRVWENHEKPEFKGAPSPALIPYYKRCLDHAKWVECIIDERYDLKNRNSGKVRPWEADFPGEEDMIIAGMMFCDLQFFLKINESRKCHRPSPSMCHGIWNGIPQVDGKVPHNESCKAMVEYVKCYSRTMGPCSPNILLLQYYELALLGGKCLEAQNAYSSFVMDFTCSAMPLTFYPGVTNYVLPLCVWVASVSVSQFI